MDRINMETVDYMLGRVTIINEGILNSGTPIKISLENNSMFGIQNKTLVGLHVDYEINKDFLLGATMLNLTSFSGNSHILFLLLGYKIIKHSNILTK